MKEKKKIILSVVLIILCISIFYLEKGVFIGKENLSITESLVTKQNNLESKFSTSGYTIENPNIIVNPYEVSPLTALILFDTEDNVSPKVTIVGKDKNTTYTHTFSNGKNHYLSIYGLYPDYENTVIIEYGDVKKEIKIKTDKLPDDFILPTSVKADKSKLDNELYFYTPSSSGYTCAYDVNGDVRWYLTTTAIWDNTRLSNGHMLISTERLVNSPYYMSGLYEIDMLGKVYMEYSIKGGYHHDYYELPNGNILVCSDDFNNEDGTVEDYIVELDRETGNIVKQFDLKNILEMTDGQSENWSSYDWFHNNSVWYDDATNSITLSGRHQDAVINIDYDTGKLNWIIGDPTNWSEEYQKYFFTPIGDDFEWQWSQHAAMITPEGYVFLFDNGNNKSKNKDEYVDATNSYSRGVMYKIDTENMTIKQVYEYGKERGSSFYSPYISDVDYISKNHYIIHSGGIVYVDGKNSNQPAGLVENTTLKSDTVELLNNKVIFELVLPTNNYRVEKLSLYSKDNDNEDSNILNYSLSKANRVGSLGKTEVTKTTYLPIITKNIDDEYTKRNITFTKEEDRLVLNGTFKKGSDEVDIILSNGIKNIYYKQSVSKKPYTALCVDILTEEETENGITIERYINNEGLSGKYNIYLELNGTIYNTGYYTEF